jgi:hypothetical protein
LQTKLYNIQSHLLHRFFASPFVPPIVHRFPQLHYLRYIDNYLNLHHYRYLLIFVIYHEDTDYLVTTTYCRFRIPYHIRRYDAYRGLCTQSHKLAMYATFLHDLAEAKTTKGSIGKKVNYYPTNINRQVREPRPPR